MTTKRVVINGAISWRAEHLGMVAAGRTRRQAEINLSRAYGMASAMLMLRLIAAGEKLGEVFRRAGVAAGKVGAAMAKIAESGEQA